MVTPLSAIRAAQSGARRIVDEAFSAYAAVDAGIVGYVAPHKLLQMASAVVKFGGLGALPTVAALRYGSRVAVIDELGELTFSDLDRGSNAIANAWRTRGVTGGQGVAILARNHRYFHYAVFAAAKCGARIVLLNTEFAGPQLREVAAREGADLLVYDEEYADLLAGIDPRFGRWRAWADRPGGDTLAAVIAGESHRQPGAPSTGSKIVLLTSGTTGTPKGAPRAEPRSLTALGAILESVPFRVGEVTECPAPLFHTLGFAHAMLAMGLGSALVIRRKFDPDAVLDSIARHSATAMIVVPVMLSRLTDAQEQRNAAAADSAAPAVDRTLRIIFVAGSQLGASLAVRATRVFGPVIYNLYGSTEVAYASIATPADLELEPSSVGHVVRGAVVKILDEAGHEVPAGQGGRIFVGNTIQFERYTGGGGKQIIDGLMSSGDVGHFDDNGLLFVDGRDDDMIVSGGENVFPGEVEDLLSGHPGVEEAAVIGVPDAKYGQRLAAFVVVRTEHAGTFTPDELRGYVKAHLARFKVPRDVLFLDSLPRNATGKVLKRELGPLIGQTE